MRWAFDFIMFCAGGCFGILTMCCVIANRWNEKEKEVMTDAGGSVKQDREPGNHDHEADGPDSGVCSTDVPTSPEGSGSEKAG